VHDFRARGPGPYWLRFATGQGILVTGLTTVLGFGTLMFSQHRGLASLGLVLTLGVSTCMITTLVSLPALLRILSLPRITKTTVEHRQRSAIQAR
jgi:predicted exporter